MFRRRHSIREARLLLLGSTALLAACVGERQAPAPVPVAALPPAVVSPPLPPPPPPPPDWRDLPLSPGDWTYQAGPPSQAMFGSGAAASLLVRCDLAEHRILLIFPGTPPAQNVLVRTSFGSRSLPLIAAEGAAEAQLPASDPFLDGMAFSRGRFTIDTAGAPQLVIPAWPEPARVIEDCRG